MLERSWIEQVLGSWCHDLGQSFGIKEPYWHSENRFPLKLRYVGLC